MSFGWSPSDIFNLAKICYEVYSFCRTAPAELEGISERLDQMGRKLLRLSTVLEKSGLGTWKQAPALEQHLLDLRAYLEPLRSVTDRNTSTPSKAKGLARLALNQDKLKRIAKSLDVNQREIDEMKIDLILACSLRNIQHVNELQTRLVDPRPLPKPTNEATHLLDEIMPVPVTTSTVLLASDSEADQSSIISTTASNASKALAMAMNLRSQPSTEAVAVAHSDATLENSLRNVQVTNEFIADVISLAEETELYSKDADPAQALERLSEITERATHFRLALHPSSSDSGIGTAQYQLPSVGKVNHDSFESEIFGHLSSMSDNASLRMWAVDRSRRSQSGPSHTLTPTRQTPPTSRSAHPMFSRLPFRDQSGDEETISQWDAASTANAVMYSDSKLSTKDLISLRGRSEVSLSMDPGDSISCSFSLEASEGSVRLRVVSTDRLHSTSDTRAVFGLLPSMLGFSSSRSQSMDHGTHNWLARTFQHCFQPQVRPIPHLLHPDVEGPTEEPNAPYTITFTERQYVSAEGAPEGPRWTNSLMYIFHEKRDQITLCEKIFGKTMVTSVGSNKVTYDGQEISHMSAIALWFDRVSEARSITFSPNVTGKKSTTKDVELQVYGRWDANQAPRNPNALTLVAGPILKVDGGSETSARLDRQTSVRPGGTFLSRAPPATLPKGKKSGKLKCTIEFTRLSDRKLFLNHLK